MPRSIFFKNGRREAEAFQQLFMVALTDSEEVKKAVKRAYIPTRHKIAAREALMTGEVRTWQAAVGLADLYHEQRYCLLNVRPRQVVWTNKEYHAKMGEILNFVQATGLATRLQLRPCRVDHQALASQIPHSMGML